jgi:hypothetical protein
VIEFILSLILAAPPAPSHVLETKDVKRVQAVLSYEITARSLKPKEWIVVAPAMPELPGQTRVQTTMSPKGALVKEAGAQSRGMVRARFKPGAEPKFDAQITYTATLRSRTMRPIAVGETPPKVAPITVAESKHYLESRGDYDFTADRFRKWLDAEKFRRGPKESEVEFARRVFQRIQANGKYEFRDGMVRRASSVCNDLTSDCGGLSILFVSVLRANSIPARTLFGRWAKSADPEEKLKGKAYFQWHVKAEFFVPGVGWAPVDMSLALDDKSPGRLMYFGKDAGDFLVQHVDPHVEVDTVHFGKETLHNLQTPVWWATGEGKADDWIAKESWTVKTLK